MTKAPLTPPVREADDPEYAANLRRATLASTVGSALEYYDFALYGLASALIFSQLFFTNLIRRSAWSPASPPSASGSSPGRWAGCSSAPTATSWDANGCSSSPSC